MSENWGAEAWRQPALSDGDKLIYSEHGRVLGTTCYRSHWLCLVKGEIGGYALLVKHGGGEERHQIGWSDRIAESMADMSSDHRYFMLYTMFRMTTDAHRAGEKKGADTYRRAFADGSLKKRKVRGQAQCKVWIEAQRAAS